MNGEKSRLLWIAVISLLLINFFTLAFIWFHQPPRDHKPRSHGGVAGFLIHELKLSNDQVKKFDSLKEMHHEQVEKIQHDIRDLHKQFFDLIKTDVPDSLKVKSIADAMAARQKDIELITFSHFADVRKLCDVKQKEKFDDIIDEAMRMMAPKPPGNRGR